MKRSKFTEEQVIYAPWILTLLPSKCMRWADSFLTGRPFHPGAMSLMYGMPNHHANADFPGRQFGAFGP